jgi:hypothetical protein
MQIAQLVLNYLQILVWPCVVIFALLRYRKGIESLISQSKVKFDFAGVTIETSLETLELSVQESLRGQKLSPEQWSWLKRLKDEGWIAYNHTYYDQLRPLRNAGLIREHPEGWLTTAREIEITILGKLLLEAWEQSQKSHSSFKPHQARMAEGSIQSVYASLHTTDPSASRAAFQVCHTSQGSPLRFDERAPTPHPSSCTALTRRGLMEINPHRESGTRFGLRQTLDRHGHSVGTAHGQPKGRFGNRLGNSVGVGHSFSGRFFHKMQHFSSIRRLPFFL